MSEKMFTEIFKEIREQKQMDRKTMKKRNTELLIKHGIKFQSFNDGLHLRVGEYDFWPSTETIMHRKTKKRYHGVHYFIRKVKESE